MCTASFSGFGVSARYGPPYLSLGVLQLLPLSVGEWVCLGGKRWVIAMLVRRPSRYGRNHVMFASKNLKISNAHCIDLPGNGRRDMVNRRHKAALNEADQTMKPVICLSPVIRRVH